MADKRISSARPLSPHLSIYKPEINMVMSIVHRITGAGLFFGLLLFVWWIWSVSAGPAYYDYVQALIGSVVGRLVLFALTFALMHHLMGGIRHLIWDTGAGFDLRTVDLLSWGTLAGSIVLTNVIWVLGYWSMGALG